MDWIYILKLLAAAGFGLIIGAVSMIPVGAVQLQIIKKSMRGQLRAAIATALGSVTSDCIYGLLILFGFGSFMMERRWQIALYGAGVLVLAGVLIKMFRERNSLTFRQEGTPKYHGRLSFVSGFSIAIANPGMLVWWVIGYHFLYGLGLFTEITFGIKALFLISACAGLGGYLIAAALAAYRLKKSFSDRTLRRINMGIFVLLTLLLLYFVFKLAGVIFYFDTGPGLK